MERGEPMRKQDCPNRFRGTCHCRPKCAVCGWGPHMAIHGGVMGKPGYVFGHEYKPLLAEGAER